MPTKKPRKLSKFGQYLKKQAITAALAAEELDVTTSYINALAAGTMTPGLKLAIEIQKWSRSAVLAASWIKA
jgi:DNA-binding XRE family transcriptional regulator